MGPLPRLQQRLMGPAATLGGQITGKFNENQSARFNRFVQKLLGIKGGAPMPTVASDLQFIHAVNSGQETRYLESWDLFGLYKTITAAAANNQFFELRNPVGSNVIGVLVRATFTNQTAADQPALTFVRNATADQSVIDTPASFDHRGRLSGSLILSDNNGAASIAIGGTQSFIDAPALGANVRTEFIPSKDFEVPILPGDAVYMTNAVNATACRMSIWWRERFLEPDERV